VATDFGKDADEIAQLYVALVKKKLKEEDVDAIVRLIPLASHVVDLAELLVNTSEAVEE